MTANLPLVLCIPSQPTRNLYVQEAPAGFCMLSRNGMLVIAVRNQSASAFNINQTAWPQVALSCYHRHCLPFLDICACLKHSQQVGSGENYQDRKGITCRLITHTRHHGASRTAAHKFCSSLCCSYLEQEQHMFLAANCLDVDFAGTQNHMQIDLASVEALELIKPLAAGASSKKGTSLYRYTAHYTLENTVAHPRCSCSRVALQHTCSCCSIVVTFQSGHA